jgi:hypothetical protein
MLTVSGNELRGCNGPRDGTGTNAALQGGLDPGWIPRFREG